MLAFLSTTRDCTGCAACRNVCPVQCISMEADAEGFPYPVADVRCVHCEKCREACPTVRPTTAQRPVSQQYSVAAVSRDVSIWKDSASGGAFSEICNTYGDHSTIVFGAGFEGLKVVHSHVVGVHHIGRFRKSKYVQSRIDDSFRQAEKFLNQGAQVIFSGTPCQIAGLRNVLGKEYENLLCIDFICHGVGSPLVFDKALGHIRQKYGQELTRYAFRTKRLTLGNVRLFVSRYTFANGRTVYINKDEYNQFFLQQLSLRPSCGSHCRFRTRNRASDITLADLKNKNAVIRKRTDYRNYSTIIVNTAKGDAIVRRLGDRMDIVPLALALVEVDNPLFFRTTHDNPQRESFFTDVREGMEIEDLARKYLPEQNNRRWERLKDWIPYRIRVWRTRLFQRRLGRV